MTTHFCFTLVHRTSTVYYLKLYLPARDKINRERSIMSEQEQRKSSLQLRLEAKKKQQDLNKADVVDEQGRSDGRRVKIVKRIVRKEVTREVIKEKEIVKEVISKESLAEQQALQVCHPVQIL